ncbi:MAG TPA: malto-oligosyltrehalose synthase, partial [Candidatus Saccharimonadales bacterium]|nr:malto-oligosyltrehalose synthase [Candidatus Saccharimonadales bacterium]
MRLTPRATYRLQLHDGFTFTDAAGVVPYLAALGISHLYLSPIMRAGAGSAHGYDVLDHSTVSPALGGETGFLELASVARSHGLGVVLDVVPNHMSILFGNTWWWDVLKHGRVSSFARAFDIGWDGPEAKLRDQILLPVLGDQYGREVDRGTIRVTAEGDAVEVRYGDHRFPVSPESVAGLAGHDAAALDRLNTDPEALHAFLEAQHYRLARWTVGDEELVYRRFFDIKELIALRAEDPDVFDAVHEIPLRLIRAGAVDGLRIDHPDGLRDPAGYFARLRAAAPDTWIVAEKILGPQERLRDDWPVDGTTGYDFAAQVGGLFIDPAAEPVLDAAYRTFTGDVSSFTETAYVAKHEVLRRSLRADVERLTELLVRICERHRRHRDHTRRDIQQAIRELAAQLPVYRTYVRPGTAESAEDVAILDAAVSAAAARRPEIDPELLAFIHGLALLRVPGDLEADFALRLQQLTAPAAAKGVEDTAFYRYTRFAATNEVGGDPGRFAVAPRVFHARQAAQAERWPRTQLATSTHDTKRSEDVRARLAVLSEVPEEWAAAVRRWSEGNRRHHAGGAPSPSLEWLYYQTLVGAWPIDAERAGAYLEKAAKEAKQETSWVDPQPAFDAGVRHFVAATLADPAFVTDLEAFIAPLIAPGRVNALAQTLLKLTAPGVPDLHQGTELWDLSLVDPDNRRPVDFGRRQELLAALDGLTPAAIQARGDDALPKLQVVRAALAARTRAPAAFAGSYLALDAMGERADHVVAFVRGDLALPIVPRLVRGLGGDW